MGRGFKYHGWGLQQNMDSALDLSYVGWSKYHGKGVLSNMDRGFDIP